MHNNIIIVNTPHSGIATNRKMKGPRTGAKRGKTRGRYVRTFEMSSLHAHFPGQTSQPLRVLPSPFNIHVHTNTPPPDAPIHLRRHRVRPQFPLRDHHCIPLYTALLGLLRPGQNGVKPLSGPHVHVHVLRHRYDPISIRRGSFDNRPRPDRYEVVCNPCNVGGDAFALGVEEHHASESGFFEHSAVDELHLFDDIEEFALNVEGWQGAVRKGLEPSPNCLKEVVVDHRLRERGSGVMIRIFDRRT